MSKASKLRKQKAVDLVCQHVPAGGKILEVSCGSGADLIQLRDRGYEVRGTNFSQYEETIDPGLVDHGVDILAGLPYPDDTFDGVLLLDVIEHLHDHDRAIAELSRVCKPDGHVIVMTPNTMRISSRLHFLFSGFFKLKRAFVGFDVPYEHSFVFHNYPPHLPIFLYQMHSHALKPVEFTVSVYKAKSWLLALPLWPFILLTTWYTTHVGERYLKDTPAAAELFRTLSSLKALCGEFWFVVGRKSELTQSGPPQTELPSWHAKLASHQPTPQSGS